MPLIRAKSYFLWLLPLAATYYSHKYLPISPVLSCAAVGLLGSIIASLIDSSKSDEAIIYSSSFIGMSLALSIYEILLIPFIAIVIFRLLLNRFNGFGGKLGTIALICTSCIMLIRPLWN